MSEQRDEAVSLIDERFRPILQRYERLLREHAEALQDAATGETPDGRPPSPTAPVAAPDAAALAPDTEAAGDDVRAAFVDVVTKASKRTTFALGSKPVSIGGSHDDQIVVPGLPAGAGAIVLEHARVQYIDGTTKQRTPLREGSQIKVADTVIVVRVVR